MTADAGEVRADRPVAARADMHVHTAFSVDSRETIDGACRAALAGGLDWLCFAEHLDLDPRDEGYGYLAWDAYSCAIAEARDRYGDRLRILKGVEVGEPHRYPREMERLAALDLDVIIGSVHWLPGGFVGDATVLREHGLAGLCERYYRELLAAVERGGFDVLAHLDLPKRYHGAAPDPAGLAKEALAAAAEGGLALEVNTSPLRPRSGRAQGAHACAPDVDLVARYVGWGGRRVTLGSDAHRAPDVGAGLDVALSVAESAGAGPVGVFIGRRFQALE